MNPEKTKVPGGGISGRKIDSRLLSARWGSAVALQRRMPGGRTGSRVVAGNRLGFADPLGGAFRRRAGADPVGVEPAAVVAIEDAERAIAPVDDAGLDDLVQSGHGDAPPARRLTL